MKKRVYLIVLAALALAIFIAGTGLIIRGCGSNSAADVALGGGVERLEKILLPENQSLLYGLPVEDFEIEEGEIERGETFSKLLNGRYNLPMGEVNRLVETAKGVFDLRDMRAGNSYTAFLSYDKDSVQSISYLVYDKSNTEYLLFDCVAPSVKVIKREVRVVERAASGVINSNLYQTIFDNKLPYELANRLDNIFKYSIDFYALQKGDSFKVIYEEILSDTTVIGVGRIYGAEFSHGGKSYLAVSFEQGSEKGYWDANGVNLRKDLLKSPLSFSARISSKFGMRIHPIRRIPQKHNGVDYACPMGTPVLAVANGTVVSAGWDKGGGGNTLKVQHSQGLTSGYLHLRNFASGIKRGVRVSQGQVIGYVGSTGQSTGPHLDFRIWKSGTPVNPLSMQGAPAEPISGANKVAFNKMRDDVIKELKIDN